MSILNRQPTGGNTPAAGLVAVAVIAVVTGAFLYQSKNAQPQTTMNETSNIGTANGTAQQQESGVYEDGHYTALGDYVSPGGAEQIRVTLTLIDGTVESSEVVSLAERPISKEKQADFIANYKQFVVGKNINEIGLSKVASSSLTPKGFMDALEEIKQEASA